jgi:hypothetical protein
MTGFFYEAAPPRQGARCSQASNHLSRYGPPPLPVLLPFSYFRKPKSGTA